MTAKKLKSFKEKLKELTRKTKLMSFDERIEKLNLQYDDGWNILNMPAFNKSYRN